MSAETAGERFYQTAEVFPLKGPVAMAAFHLDEIEESDEQAGYPATQAQVDEELDRLFGEENGRGAEYLAGLVLWIKNTEASVEIQKALAEPHQAEADRHKQRAKALEKRGEWLRGRLAILVEQQQGGRFTDGIHKVHVREYPSAVILGTCNKHEGEHFEMETCGSSFDPVGDFPLTMARVKVEPKKAEIKTELLRLEHEGKPMPRWAQLARKLVAVIR